MSIDGKKNLISILSFFAIIAGLLLVATFYDLEIDLILTKCSLSAGDYYTNNVYANFFEAMGMLPRYLLPAFAGIIVMWLFYRSTFPKALRVIIFLGGFIYAVYVLSGAFRDMVEYPISHIVATYDLHEQKALYYPLKPYFYALEYFCSAVTVTLAAFLTRRVKYETWCKLAVFAVAVLIVQFLTSKTISALKSYVDRTRFRAMNSELGQSVGGFDLYTRWYEVTDNADLLRTTALTEYKDAFRSFPSGHTSNAGISYCIIMLIPCLEIKDRRIRAALWITPIVWTGLTAIGRMVAGAHFFSDVLFGGTIVFLYMILVREVLILHGKNVRSMWNCAALSRTSELPLRGDEDK